MNPINALVEQVKGRKDELLFAGVLITIASVFFYTILGIVAVLTLFGILLFFVLPSYIILSQFDLTEAERLCLSFFLGAGLFPIPVYYLGFVISFKLAIWVSLGAILVVSIMIFYFRKWKTI